MKLKKSLKNAGTHFPQLLKKEYKLVINLFALSWPLDHLFNTFDAMAKASPETNGFSILAILGPLFISLISWALLSCVIPCRYSEYSHHASSPSLNQSTLELIRIHLKSICLEGLRLMSNVLLWSLLFIIPGIFKQIRYSLVPQIVTLNPNYASGDVDVLFESNKMVKGHTAMFFFIMLGVWSLDFCLEVFVPHLTPPLSGRGFDLSRHLIHFFIAMPVNLIQVIVSFFVFCLMSEIYLDLKQKNQTNQSHNLE